MATPAHVLDPAVIPSLVPRVERICALLREASGSSSAEVPSDPSEQPEHDDAPPATAPIGANLALGTIADDDDVNPYLSHTEETGSRGGPQRVPAALGASLARDATAFVATLEAARAAVRATPGVDMSTDEQIVLLRQLENYATKQKCVRGGSRS